MRRRLIAVLLIGWLGMGAGLSAQPSTAGSGQGRSRAALWTVVGAGAGFGVGLWAGLAAFDDSIDSDRKVWTTAILSAAAGGVLGYLIGRNDSRPAVRPGGSVDAAGWTAPTPKDAPPLGSGAFRAWLGATRAIDAAPVHSGRVHRSGN